MPFTCQSFRRASLRRDAPKGKESGQPAWLQSQPPPHALASSSLPLTPGRAEASCSSLALLAARETGKTLERRCGTHASGASCKWGGCRVCAGACRVCCSGHNTVCKSCGGAKGWWERRPFLCTQEALPRAASPGRQRKVLLWHCRSAAALPGVAGRE